MIMIVILWHLLSVAGFGFCDESSGASNSSFQETAPPNSRFFIFRHGDVSMLLVAWRECQRPTACRFSLGPIWTTGPAPRADSYLSKADGSVPTRFIRFLACSRGWSKADPWRGTYVGKMGPKGSI